MAGDGSGDDTSETGRERAWADDVYCSQCGRPEPMRRKRRTINGETVCHRALCGWMAKGWMEDDDFRQIVAEVIASQ